LKATIPVHATGIHAKHQLSYQQSNAISLAQLTIIMHRAARQKILLHRSFNPTTPRHRLTIPVLRFAGMGSLPHPIQSANHYIQPEPCLGTTTAT
jgi:hypothetical protein